ncbi:hypothetical protein GALMADRAFT_142899 [Galerina marginata CBS 339.88]|uniref:Uncharacterized protein n=1 Tax=Galerina marginata (strain CBS 339.88) TaxID=685588 RepID=A0A067SY21_GALM3|nr:hypothetical protein GALMADRAFT_142899 [Galerina marginata CBS 339.88]
MFIAAPFHRASSFSMNNFNYSHVSTSKVPCLRHPSLHRLGPPPSMPTSLIPTSAAASSILPAATPESTNVMDTMACMAAFAETYPNTHDVADHTALLVDLAIYVSEWGGTKREDLENIGIGWTPRNFLR